MADAADIATDIVIATVEVAAINARAPIAVGTAGECDQCEWWMPRLVDGQCGFCRDGRPRPPDWEPPTPPSSSQEAMPPISEEIVAMPAKSIQLPATATAAIAAVEQHAAAANLSIGQAAASLIERGIAAALVTAMDKVPINLCEVEVDELLREIGSRVQQATSPEVVEQLVARAESAESKLAGMRQLLA